MISDYHILLKLMPENPVLRWLLGATFICLCEIWITRGLWKKYGHKSQSGTRGFHISFADSLTFTRGLFVAGAAGFFLLPKGSGWLQWVPGLLYFAAIAFDYADGYFARRQHKTSEFGAALDRNFDGLTTLMGSVLAIRYGRLPLWYLGVGLAFFVFSSAVWVRQKSGVSLLSLPPNKYRRFVGGSNALFIGLSLLPFIPGTWLCWIGPIMATAIFWGFWRDWRYISQGSANAH